VQIGRLRGDSVGVLGSDGSFGNDGRFHPFGPSTTKQAYCGQNDGAGHAFLNVQLGQQPASGQGAGFRTISHCRLASEIPAAKRALSRNESLSSSTRSRALRLIDSWAVCPGGDLRYVQYGLLGPEATSITYSLGGRSATERVHGPDGAYLVVGESSPSACARFGPGGCAGSAPQFSAQIAAGMITAVHYRDGHTCGLRFNPARESAILVSCPLAGHVPAKPPVSESQVAAPVSVRLIKAKRYCFTRETKHVTYLSTLESRPAPATDIGPYLPCDGPVPANEVRDPSNSSGSVIAFSWTARIPVTSTSSRYEFLINDPCGTGSGGSTIGHIRAGERLTRGVFEFSPCKGTATGSVYYDPSVGPNGFTPFRPTRLRRGQTGAILVGRFSITVR
jgi:hypothetical protein